MTEALHQHSRFNFGFSPISLVSKPAVISGRLAKARYPENRIDPAGFEINSRDRWNSRKNGSVGVAVPNAPDVLAVKPLIFFELRQINPDLRIANLSERER
ncbi:hypothetical protein C8J56DRAFT_879784 [Mycena floridula]|nr:hypothetical protein C8J56DRAFT_879784 [Mycena floridula]